MPRLRELACAVAALAFCVAAAAQDGDLTAESARKLAEEAATVYRAGDPARAQAMLEKALDYQRRHADRAAEEDVLYALGIVQRARGQAAQALATFEAAHAINRQRQGEGEALLLQEIGFTLLDLGRFAEAEKAFTDERALHAAAKDAKAEAEALHNLGFARAARAKSEGAAGRYAEALQAFEEALPLRRAAGDTEGEARTLEFVAQMQAELGQPALGVEPAQKAVAAFRSLGHAEGADRAATLLAQLQAAVARAGRPPPSERQRAKSGEANDRHNACAAKLQTGNAAGARADCEAARKMFADAGDRGGEAMALVSLGMIDVLLSEYERARQSLVRGLALAREVGSESQANATNLLGMVDLATGHLPQALTRFELALAAYERQHDLEQVNRARGNIAGTLVALGRYDEAVAVYQALAGGPGVGRAQTLHNLATVQALRKDFPAARDMLEQAAALQRSSRDPLLRSSLANLGAVLAALGEAASAVPVLQEALALDRQFGDQASESGTLASLGEMNARLGRPAEALALFAQAGERARDAGVAALQSTALAGTARVLESQGRLEQALEADRQAIAVDEARRAAGGIEEAKTAFAASAAEKQQHAARLLLKLKRPAEAFEMAERSRARTLLDQLGNARLEVRTDGAAGQEQRVRIELAALDRLLMQQRNKPAPQRDTAGIEDLQRKLADKRREHEQLLLRLKAADPEFASLVDVAPPRLPELQALLEPDTTLLSYLVTPDAVLAFVVTRNDLQATELPLTEATLRTAIEELRLALGTPGQAPVASLQRLSAMLVDPLRAQLKTPRLGIVPHGVLHELPFAALRDAASGRWLGEDFELFHLPSASVLPFLAAKRKATRGPLLAMAQGQAPGLPPLRQAEAEARAVAALFDSTPLVGAQATEAALRERAPQAGILHIAAHGQLNAVAPLFSRLVLAGDDELDATRDGMLEVREIYGLDLRQASLVVLSACQTQLGSLSRGDDMVGMNRAFLYAGAPAVVASLWKVDDQATANLMTAFYGHLRQGLGPAAALRAAQAEVRSKDPDPFRWAAFVLTGEPR